MITNPDAIDDVDVIFPESDRWLIVVTTLRSLRSVHYCRTRFPGSVY
jgi:hypothetical protein